MGNYFTNRDPGAPIYVGEVDGIGGNEGHVFTEEARALYLLDIANELKVIETMKPEFVLDVGCGPGWLASELSGSIEVHSYDPDPEVIEYANENCGDGYSEIRRRHFFCAGVEEVVAKEGYDAVFCHRVIEKLADPVRAVRIMFDALYRQGWLIISTPDFNGPPAKRFRENFRHLHDPSNISLFSLDGLAELLRDVGFVIEARRFPFPDRYATAENYMRWNDATKESPPWPGEFVTFFCRKP